MTRLEDLTYAMDVCGDSKYTCYLESDDVEVIKLLASKSGLNVEHNVFTNSIYNTNNIPNIKDVIFNPPATIVLWEDGTKTVVKIDNRYDKGYQYDPEKGLAMCISKKVLGNKGNYYELFKKYIWNKDDVFLNSYKDYPAIVSKDIYKDYENNIEL